MDELKSYLLGAISQHDTLSDLADVIESCDSVDELLEIADVDLQLEADAYLQRFRGIELAEDEALSDDDLLPFTARADTSWAFDETDIDYDDGLDAAFDALDSLDDIEAEVDIDDLPDLDLSEVATLDDATDGNSLAWLESENKRKVEIERKNSLPAADLIAESAAEIAKAEAETKRELEILRERGRVTVNHAAAQAIIDADKSARLASGTKPTGTPIQKPVAVGTAPVGTSKPVGTAPVGAAKSAPVGGAKPVGTPVGGAKSVGTAKPAPVGTAKPTPTGGTKLPPKPVNKSKPLGILSAAFSGTKR
jgi:hypothetical protein